MRPNSKNTFFIMLSCGKCLHIFQLFMKVIYFGYYFRNIQILRALLFLVIISNVNNSDNGNNNINNGRRINKYTLRVAYDMCINITFLPIEVR